MTPGGPATARALYVHVPQCRVLCGYCEYDVAALSGADPGRFVDALSAEFALRSVAGIAPSTVLIGGGTPTALPVKQLARLLEVVRGSFVPDHAPDEWTVEANPEDVTPECVRVLANAGVTRCSIGVQSLRNETLAALGRQHTREQALCAIDVAGAAGLTLSVDVLHGAPGQRAGDVAADVDAIVELGLEHVSLFGLSSRGANEARNQLSFHGLRRYELTSYARPGAEGQHQLGTFRGEPSLGLGPAAAGWLDGERRVNTRDAGQWERQVREGTDPIGEQERPRGAAGMREDAMARLHLAEGFSWDELEARWGVDPVGALGGAVAELGASGLLAERPDGRVVLTREGQDRADEALMRVLEGAV